MMRGMRMRGGVKPQDVGRTIRRLMSYVARYRLRLLLVVLCIILSAVASVLSSTFIGVLIDDYISPLLLQAEPVFTGLARALGVMVCVYVVGMVSGYFYNRLMVNVAQGVLKNVRDEMFAHMQTLPIRYFDTHSHGEVMSHFTNDTDTLRQMIAQALPQVLSSVVSLVAVVCAMLSLSLWLTLFVLAFAVLMLYITKRVSAQSGKYFVKQQQSLADVNGYIEEMINGQKVVKVFCHEQKAIEEFDRRNDELCRNATAANKFANILGPVNNNLGHLLYVLLAVVGAAMGLAGLPNVGLAGADTITLGMIASFMTLSRSFVMPLSQVSQQLSAVIMALAGAERIFRLMDEPSEHDDGYVTLVNARRENGQIVESEERTGLWAWKHPHHDGTLTYTELKGDIVLDDVDFGYVPDKTVLHNISLYAKPGQKIAFVGATGAGKTTITNLLNRFYDIADGKIRYDGININKIKKPDLRRSLGIVLQDTHLFTGKMCIRDRIVTGDQDAGVLTHTDRDLGDLRVAVGGGVGLVQQRHALHAVFAGLHGQGDQILCSEGIVQRGGQGPLQESIHGSIVLKQGIGVLGVGGKALETVGDQFPQGADVLVLRGQDAHLSSLGLPVFTAVPEGGGRQGGLVLHLRQQALRLA